ncbi:glycoside hydrolase domain-containing protein [Niabella sp. 22666]|uniref:glycoside hydrolase domain-containing protein n=1 Tax=Niabella sp. 22666 TaxID=3453954 RepID=UPI003F857B58
MRYLFAALLFICHPAIGQSLKYISGNNTWNADSLGNHRFIVKLSREQFLKNGRVAHVTIPWRRHDDDVAQKRVIMVSENGTQPIDNIKVIIADNEQASILFEPLAGAGNYFVYYMPYRNEGRSNYPKGVYLKQAETASADWLKQTLLKRSFGEAAATAYESVNAFNTFYPMGMIATGKETKQLINASANKKFIVFPEDRMHPVQMRDYLPYRWVQKGIRSDFKDTAARGEYFTYQLGVHALNDLENVHIEFSDLISKNKQVIPSKYISCINTNGTDYKGNVLLKQVDVPAGTIQSMWCAIDVPLQTVPGVYTGKATVKTNQGGSQVIQLTLVVSNKVVKDAAADPEKQTRLKWLNSTLAQENTVIAPYTPLQVTDTTISFLGRKVQVNKDGFPAQIQTFFKPEMTSIGTVANNILAEPIHFHHIESNGKAIQWKNEGVRFLQKDAGTVKWEAVNTSQKLRMQVNAALEFDGFLAYTVQLVALDDLSFKDITFHIPVNPAMADYFMGLGNKGGQRPDSILWKWDVAHKNQDGGWIGNVNAGLQFSLRDEHYVRPLNTNFYLQKPLLLPQSWGNATHGGIDVFKKGSSVLVNAYNGARSMKAGDTLYYNFNLLITPFHAINTDFQWKNRFYHKYEELNSIKSKGASLVNIHHANAINPYINYPFIEWKKMKAYIDSAHALGLKVKIYNTVRELSNKAYETYALRSLGHEIYSPGPGGGFSWLQEQVGKDYIAAWFVPEIKDAAIVNSGMSRWHNYYVEGMNWLVKNVGIDGIYLDDVAFDRITMKRIKRILTQHGAPGIIDLHSANQFNKSDGFNNSANLYMEHFPYLNRLWFGEYFDYEKNDPAFFLTEVSGIPFGLMGEMLQDGGNAWRGMVYGMTNRIPWSDNADPRPIWKIWDDFGMEGTEMIGYWVAGCPVKTNHQQVLATVYKKNGAALVSLASWANSDEKVKLGIDWEKLGIDPAKATITAPAINNFQEAKTFRPDDLIPVEKNKGWILIIK